MNNLKRDIGWAKRVRLSGMASVAAFAVFLAVPSTGSANNDPHRSFNFMPPSTSLPGTCSFDFSVTPVVNNQYVKPSPGPNGSTVLGITGSLFMRLTNLTDTSKSIVVNQSGPSTVVIPAGFPDTNPVVSVTGRGNFGFGLLGATGFGFPSNAVETTGLFEYTVNAETATILSVTRMPRVALDVCAALS